MHPRFSSSLGRAFAILTLLRAAGALAQQAADAGAEEEQTQRATRDLEELLGGQVSTGTKNAGSATRLAGFIEVITADEIRVRGYRHLADLLNDVRNNHEDRSNWGIGEPLHQNVGFGYRFDTGQNILILFNGQRLNAFLPGNRFGGEEYLLDDLEQVEVIRGPGSAIYGANAFTAVVNLISKSSVEPGEKSTLRASAGGAPTSGGVEAGLSWKSRVGQNGVTSGAFHFLREEGQNLSIENNLFGDLRVRDAVRHVIGGEAYFGYGKFHAYLKADNQLRNTFTGFNSVNPGNNDKLTLSYYAYSVGADHTLELGEKVKIRNSVGLTFDNWTEVALIPVFKLNSAGTGLEKDSDGLPILDTVTLTRNGQSIDTSFVIDGQGADTMTLSAESVLTLKYYRENTLTFGLNVIHDRILAARRPTEITLSPAVAFGEFKVLSDDANNWLFDPHATRTGLGAFAQVDYEIIEGLTATVGARFDVFTGTGLLNQSYPAFNPRAAIVYHQPKVGLLKVLYGAATRIPNGFETLSSVAILGTPDNRPEHLDMIQAAWERAWSSNLRTELGGFYSRVSSRLITDSKVDDLMASQGFIGRFVNVDASKPQQSAGVDAKVSFKAGPVHSSVNFTRYFATDDGNGNPLAYIPMTMVNANVNVPVGWFNFNLNGNYRGQFTPGKNDTRPPVRDSLLLNATASFVPPQVPFEVRLGARNLLNTAIQYPSSSQDYRNYFPSRRIELWGDLRFTVGF
jgi:outer membrane receptor protein involved in Fe transport